MPWNISSMQLYAFKFTYVGMKIVWKIGAFPEDFLLRSGKVIDRKYTSFTLKWATNLRITLTNKSNKILKAQSEVIVR